MAAKNGNILLLILDSARARNTSVHDYHRDTTPFLDEFAQTATTYTQARAPAGWSLPSHLSIFSGHLPQEHGVHDIGQKLDQDASVFGRLANKGYETGLFTDNPYLTDLDTGLSDGFDTVVNNRDLFAEGESPSAFVEEESLNRTEFFSRALRSDAPVKSILNGVSWALKWRFPRLLPGNAVFSQGFTYAENFEEWWSELEGPWAACINLMDTHVPFRPGDNYDRWNSSDSRKAYRRVDMDNVDDDERWKYVLLENRYDGTIRQADAVVEQIITALDDADELANTCVVVTADHGEGFGEPIPGTGDFAVAHGESFAEPLLHVPLVVKSPGQREARTVSEPVGLVDTPVAVDRVIEEVNDDSLYVTDRTVFAGASIDGNRVDVAYARDESRGVRKYVRRGGDAWTVHVPSVRAAYHLRDGIPEHVEAEMNALSRAGVTHDTDAEVSDRTEERLRALGYAE